MSGCGLGGGPLHRIYQRGLHPTPPLQIIMKIIVKIKIKKNEKKFKKIVDIISKQAILVFKLAITLTNMNNLYEY